jgi:hypothetical protein
LTKEPAFSPDLPELRLLAQLAGLRPSAFAAALNNSEHFSEHISADELSRYLASQDRLLALVTRIGNVLFAELDRTPKNKRT